MNSNSDFTLPRKNVFLSPLPWLWKNAHNKTLNACLNIHQAIVPSAAKITLLEEIIYRPKKFMIIISTLLNGIF